MALPKPRHQPEQEPTSQPERFEPSIGRAEIVRSIFDDLRKHAPPEGEDDGWDELVEALDAERPEGMKLFPK